MTSRPPPIITRATIPLGEPRNVLKSSRFLMRTDANRPASSRAMMMAPISDQTGARVIPNAQRTSRTPETPPAISEAVLPALT